MYLAELNDDNLCVGIKQVGAFIDDGKHVEIDNLDSSFLWKKYENGEWTVERFEPLNIESQPTIEEEILYENKYQTLLLEMGML